MLYNYPTQARVGRVLPKSKIYQNAKISAAVKKKFVEQIDKIVWEYKLSPETINLPARDNAPEIEIFIVELRVANVGEDVLRLIDNAIPFPIIFELKYENRVRTKAAYKRLSEAETGKWVTEIYFESDWRELAAPVEELPLALDLGVLYEKIVGSLIAAPKKAGEEMREYVARLAEIRRRETEAAKLETRIKREKQFNRKMELNAELKKLRNELARMNDA